MITDDSIALEWARIPHFYYNYYVYQYATSYSAAIAVARRILNEGESAVKDYLEFLSGGGSTGSHRPAAGRRGGHGRAQAHSGRAGSVRRAAGRDGGPHGGVISVPIPQANNVKTPGGRCPPGVPYFYFCVGWARFCSRNSAGVQL